MVQTERLVDGNVFAMPITLDVSKQTIDSLGVKAV